MCLSFTNRPKKTETKTTWYCLKRKIEVFFDAPGLGKVWMSKHKEGLAQSCLCFVQQYKQFIGKYNPVLLTLS